MFNDPIWKVDKLQELKTELITVRNYIRTYNFTEWYLHTQLRCRARDILTRLRRDVQPEMLSREWAKFYEMVSSFPLVPITRIDGKNKHFKSVHLCEAPGDFILSLNHWLKTNVPNVQWDWIATSFNPYYDGNELSSTCMDDRFIRHTLRHWCFGDDATGNIMNLQNLDKLIKFSEPHSDIFLITADGCVDSTEIPGEQENMLTHLKFCEIIAALHLLQSGGSFLLKYFTVFECHSVCLIYLLCCCFNEVSIIKPATSKEGNSETFLVCTNFKGSSYFLPYSEKLRQHYECGPKNAIFNKNDIPSAFIERIIEGSEFFVNHQSSATLNQIFLFNSSDSRELHDMKHIQRTVADKYIRLCNLKKLRSGEIVGITKLNACRSTKVSNAFHLFESSRKERCKRKLAAQWDELKDLFYDSTKIEIKIPSDKPVQFDAMELPENLQITTGKLFHRICSSKFCNDNILNIQTSVHDILVDMGLNVQFPSIETINELRNDVLSQSGHQILIFQYTDVHDSHNIINKTYDAVQNLDLGDTLVLTGYSLLTYLNVGLLYLVSCAFETLKITLCGKTGAKITFEYYNNNMQVLKYLADIKAVSLSVQETGNSVLHVIPPLFLYDCYLFQTIVAINHWVSRSYVNCVMNTVKGNMIN
ncbi:FtsJ methyltransferase domain-containing protein 1 [Dufourea novaeangliae]|uniref:Cap-specific mRNA (nucleoside-2'-O-)-methyltransferase 2 n=2 Tax=Dufourea novaeangliae TaxID=178035 RepID=A0A154P666_DUFNO|nr:FtsJ methyltransferase domain-containing protein 1 [Dufourea novaeangliae]